MSTKKKKRTAEETLKAIQDQADADEMERILALTDEELDAELRAGGIDPVKARADGAAFAAEMSARRKREIEAAVVLERVRGRLAERRARRGKLPRAEILSRIEAARTDRRLPQPAAVLYRKQAEGEATDEELEALLDKLEELIELQVEGSGEE